MSYSDNILSYYHRATPDDVRDGRVWYPGMRAIMDAHADYTGLTPLQCAGTYAIASTNTTWARNIAIASQWLLDFGNDTLPNDGHLDFVLSYVHHILVEGLSIDDVVKDKNALKVRSFVHNLCDDPDYVTVDRWAFRIATDFADCPTEGRWPCKSNGGHGCGKVPKGIEYNTIADAYRQAASIVAERPHDLQAITWCVVRGKGE